MACETLRNRGVVRRHLSLERLARVADVSERGAAVSGGHRGALCGDGAIRGGASESVGVESAAVWGAADAVPVCAARAVLQRGLDPRAARDRAGDGVPDDRRAGNVPGTGDAVSLRGAVYGEPEV